MGPVLLGDFQLHAVLAKGSTALVYSGSHRVHRTPAAIKVLAGEAIRDDRYRQDFATEARTIAALNHPSIIRLFDQGAVDEAAVEASAGRMSLGAPYLVMERLDYGSLHTLRRIPAPWSVLHLLLCQTLEGLGYAHARGVLHCDLKPSNVLIANLRTDAVRIADFGLARVWGRGETPLPEAARIIGTPAYMAPEQATGSWRDWGPETDLYALGCLAWSLLTGVPPLVRASAEQTLQAQVRDSPPVLLSRVPVPVGTDAWLHRLLQKRPGDRFRTASDALQALYALGDRAGPVRSARPGDTPATPPTGVEPHPTDSLTTPISPVPMPDLPAADVEPVRPRAVPIPPADPPVSYRPVDDASTLDAGLRMLPLRRPRLIGQEGVRRALWTALRGVCTERSPRAVLLRGPAGIGKTRLASWLSANASELGYAQTLICAHSPFPGPLVGLPAALGRRLGCQRLDPTRVADRLVRLGLPLQRGPIDDVESLARILGESALRVDDAGGVADPSQRGRLLVRVLGALAAARPLIVVVDDAQWAGPTLDVVARTLDDRAGPPVLFVLAARDEGLVDRPVEGSQLATLAAHDRCQEQRVEPLSDDEIRRLLAVQLPLDRDLSATVEAHAGGNPAFALQVVRGWAQRGELELDGSQFRLRAGASSDVPTTLVQVWKHRVRSVYLSLSTGQRQALEIGAAMGHVVDAPDWRHIARRAGAEPDAELIDVLASRGLVRVLADEASWVFAHGGARECVLEAARSRGVLARHHSAIADALAQTDDADPGRIGVHRFEGGDYAAAVGPLLAASEALQGVGGDARPLLSRCRRALDGLEPAARRDRELHWMLLHARSLGYLQQHDAAMTALGRLWARLGDDGDPRLAGRAHLLAADLHLAAGQTSEALEHADRAWEVCDRAGDVESRLRADVSRSAILTWTGRLDQAEPCADRAVRDAPPGSQTSALALLRRGDLHRALGEFDASLADYRKAQRTCEQLGDRRLWSFAANNQAEIHRLQGRFDTARSLYEEVLALGVVDVSSTGVNLVLLALAEDRFDEMATRLNAADFVGLPSVAAGLVHLLRMCVDARARKWDDWDRNWAAATDKIAAAEAVDRDFAEVALRAGILAMERDEGDRAKRVLALAERQARLTHDAAVIARCEAALAAG